MYRQEALMIRKPCKLSALMVRSKIQKGIPTWGENGNTWASSNWKELLFGAEQLQKSRKGNYTCGLAFQYSAPRMRKSQNCCREMSLSRSDNHIGKNSLECIGWVHENKDKFEQRSLNVAIGFSPPPPGDPFPAFVFKYGGARGGALILIIIRSCSCFPFKRQMK